MAKILVVDDELEIANLIAEVASDYNHTVFVALNGNQAFEICMREKPQLVISDISMPGLDGYGLTQKIKADPELSGLKLVLMTAGFFRPELVEGIYDGFIKKPFEIEEIEVLLEDTFPLKTHSSRPSLEKIEYLSQSR